MNTIEDDIDTPEVAAARASLRKWRKERLELLFAEPSKEFLSAKKSPRANAPVIDQVKRTPTPDQFRRTDSLGCQKIQRRRFSRSK